MQYLILFILFSILFFFIKRWLLFGIALLMMFWHLFLILPFYLKPKLNPKTDKIKKASLKILYTNFLAYNRQYPKLLKYIRRKNPDLIGIVETTTRLVQFMKANLKDYPYRTSKARNDFFGISLWSKIPFAQSKVVYWGNTFSPIITTRFTKNNKDFYLILAHPTAPKNVRLWKLRNNQLSIIAQRINQFSGSKIIIGDFNITPFSYFYHKFISLSKLYESRKGFGIHNSWPVNNILLRIPIDHCFLSSDIKVIKREVGPNIGSDHYPFYLELGF